MASLLPLPPSTPSKTTTPVVKKTPTSNNTAKFTRLPIPSWMTLNHSSSSTTTNQNQSGVVENLHLVSLSKQGKFDEALDFIKQMEEGSSVVTTHSCKCLLDLCVEKGSSLSKLRMVHEVIRTIPNKLSGVIWEFLLQKYCEMGCLVDARRVFDEMPDRDSDTWITMAFTYAQNGCFLEAFGLLLEVLIEGLDFYRLVCVSLIQVFNKPSCLEIGKLVHSHLIRTGLASNVSVSMALFTMYVKCGCLENSKLVFDGMAKRDVVSCTRLLVGYTQLKKPEEALILFRQMTEEGLYFDGFAVSAVIKACTLLYDVGTGRTIHGSVIKCGMDLDVSVGTPIVDFYVKCGSLDEACNAFKRISRPNDVSWSSIIAGYSKHGKVEKCLKAFKNVRNTRTFLNSSIYTSIFQACSMLADLNMGTQVHADAIKRCLVSDLYGESALITMYSRCGKLDNARRAFDLINKPDTVAWSAIITGCAYHGHASEALQLFEKMRSCGVRPNIVTFIGLLTACSHSGLVLEARQYWDLMSSEFGVEPTLDHYDCMIDIYSRAGRLEDAFDFTKTMPFEPDVTSWKSLLGGCWMYRNVELGKIAAENLLQLDPEDTAGYILLFNLYASSGKWDEAANVRKLMAEKDLRKDVSCSWLTIKGKVHRFVVGDRHHPQTEEIYSKLEELKCSITKDGLTLISNSNVSYNLSVERQQQLLDHSERLAIAYGLISTPSNAPLLIFKNLRSCADCHDFAKYVSKIACRKIVVRDSSRFHHFILGECSCNDYW